MYMCYHATYINSVPKVTQARLVELYTMRNGEFFSFLFHAIFFTWVSFHNFAESITLKEIISQTD